MSGNRNGTEPLERGSYLPRSRCRRSLLLGPALAFGIVILGLALSACNGDDDDASEGTPAGTEIVRDVLQSGVSEAAPGQALELTRVVIPPAKDIPPHTHPGPQLALIVEGELSYSVIRGEVEVTRSGSESPETIAAGESTTIEPGDSLAEPTGVVHTARNDGPGQVVILVSALFPEGAPASSQVPQ